MVDNSLETITGVYRKFEEEGGKDLAKRVIHDITLFESGKPHDRCDHYSLYSHAMDLLECLRAIPPLGVQEAINYCDKIRQGEIILPEDLRHVANLLILTELEDRNFLHPEKK